MINILFCGREEMVLIFRLRLLKRLLCNSGVGYAHNVYLETLSNNLDKGIHTFFSFVFVDWKWLNSDYKYERILTKSLNSIDDFLFLETGKEDALVILTGFKRVLNDPVMSKYNLVYIYMDRAINLIIEKLSSEITTN